MQAEAQELEVADSDIDICGEHVLLEDGEQEEPVSLGAHALVEHGMPAGGVVAN